MQSRPNVGAGSPQEAFLLVIDDRDAAACRGLAVAFGRVALWLQAGIHPGVRIGFTISNGRIEGAVFDHVFAEAKGGFVPGALLGKTLADERAFPGFDDPIAPPVALDVVAITAHHAGQAGVPVCA